MSPAVIAMFALWVAYGVWQWRRSSIWFEKVSAVPRTKRASLATLWLFGGASLLLGVLYAVFSFGGFAGGGVEPWAWLVCAAAGLVFVHAQAMAGALLVSMAVTQRRPDPSHNEKEGSSS